VPNQRRSTASRCCRGNPSRRAGPGGHQSCTVPVAGHVCPEVYLQTRQFGSYSPQPRLVTGAGVHVESARAVAVQWPVRYPPCFRSPPQLEAASSRILSHPPEVNEHYRSPTSTVPYTCLQRPAYRAARPRHRCTHPTRHTTPEDFIQPSEGPAGRRELLVR
jgi:hypothetical protein